MLKDCFYKHTLNVLVNHHLENVEILSSVFMPIKQDMQKNMLYSIQGQGLQGCTTWSISFVRKSGQMAGLDLLGMLVMQGGRGYGELLGSWLHYKSLLCVDSRSGICALSGGLFLDTPYLVPHKNLCVYHCLWGISSFLLGYHPSLAQSLLGGCGCTRCKQWLVIGLLET